MRCRTGVRMAFLAMLAASHPAWADRAGAEKLAHQAEASDDPAGFVACGQAFLEVYNQDPEAVQNDEVLFDAARCFERGAAISAALQADAMVIKSFPSSKLASKATSRSGRMYERIAMYDRAADRFEAYAKRYGGERDAGDTLADAIRLRAALGDRAKQIEDTKEWIRMFGLKRKADAAAAELSLVAVLDAEGALAQLHEFLKTYAAVDPALTIAAHIQLADRLRAKSCPVHAIDQLCVKAVVDRAPHCGASPPTVAAVPRTAENREALAEYRAVIALADKANDPAARHARAMARLALADDELEALIATPFPHDLDIARLDSRRRLSQWLDGEIKRGGKVVDAYSAVLVQKDATSSVAAAARISQVSLALWRAVTLGELPKAMRKGDLHDAYCDELKVVADPLKARAIEAAWACLAKSVELQAGQEWADMCWRDGAAIDPEPFAPVREHHGAPGGFAAPIALEPPIAASPVISPPPP